MFFQPFIQVTAMAEVEFIDRFGIDDVKVKHVKTKKRPGKTPNPELNVGDNGFEPLTPPT